MRTDIIGTRIKTNLVTEFDKAHEAETRNDVGSKF
jgi:hypothetical protein